MVLSQEGPFIRDNPVCEVEEKVAVCVDNL